MKEKLVLQFADLVMHNIRQEYPNKISHAFNEASDLKEPHLMYPIFYGSFDWHSSVHSHWLLVKIVRSYSHCIDSQKAVSFLNEQFSLQKAQGELEYLVNPAHKGFERPYGWGWFLKLFLEVSLLAEKLEDAKVWAKYLKPIADFFAKEFKEYLAKADYPIRVGTHFNSAFALVFALEYARFFADKALEERICERAKKWFSNDCNMQVLEPCGDEFLSPVLMEAVLMQKVLSPSEFETFFQAYLPNLAQKEPKTLFTLALVSDRSDGKIAHLDGLNLSRAWCLRELSNSCQGALKELLRENADLHFNDAIEHIEEDYYGSHWLGSFAMLAMDVKLV